MKKFSANQPAGQPAVKSEWPDRRKEFAKAIRDSCLKDYRDWVSARADELTDAAAVGDAKRAAEIVRTLRPRAADPVLLMHA